MKSGTGPYTEFRFQYTGRRCKYTEIHLRRYDIRNYELRGKCPGERLQKFLAWEIPISKILKEESPDWRSKDKKISEPISNTSFFNNLKAVVVLPLAKDLEEKDSLDPEYHCLNKESRFLYFGFD